MPLFQGDRKRRPLRASGRTSGSWRPRFAVTRARVRSGSGVQSEGSFCSSLYGGGPSPPPPFLFHSLFFAGPSSCLPLPPPPSSLQAPSPASSAKGRAPPVRGPPACIVRRPGGSLGACSPLRPWLLKELRPTDSLARHGDGGEGGGGDVPFGARRGRGGSAPSEACGRGTRASDAAPGLGRGGAGGR